MEYFKFLFIILGIFIVIYLALGAFLNNSIPLRLLDDPVYLTFKIVVSILICICLLLMWRWRTAMIMQQAKNTALNNNLQEQISLINSASYLEKLEKIDSNNDNKSIVDNDISRLNNVDSTRIHFVEHLSDRRLQ